MRKTATAILAALAIAAPLGVAHAGTVSFTIATPGFGLQIGPPVYAPPVYIAAPVVAPAPVYVTPAPVVVPRYVVVPPPVYPVAYPYAVVRPPKHHKRAYPAPYRGAVPVVAAPYGRY
jgi:hypothetical protein